MRRVDEDARIWIFLVFICYGSCILSKSDVRPIGVIHERSWCAELKHAKHVLHIDLGRVRAVTGFAARKDDTAMEIQLSYKKENDRHWHLYEEEGRVKIFGVNEKSQGLYSRQWFQRKISARYLKFRVTGWREPACLHVEVYGFLENFENLQEDGLEELSREPEDERKDLEGNFEDDEIQEAGEPTAESDLGKPKKGDNKLLTIGLCFLATGVIALLALIIVCKWERHERKIRPDILRTKLRQNAKSNLGR